MKCLDDLLSRNTKPNIVQNYKQPERKLLAVFMGLLEIIPEYRSAFLQRCDYGSGLTCSYYGMMEPRFHGSHLPEVRPDGLLTCKRGNTEWAAFIEAKSGTSDIRPEQIHSYAELAKALDIDTLISISNEFAVRADELPYHLSVRQRKGRRIYHFSWAELRTFTEIFYDQTPDLNDIARQIIRQSLNFFWDEKSGILTYDAMPVEWPDFVESASTSLGFSTKTRGITEIVHGWQQERRDLTAKIIFQSKNHVELRHMAGVRADADERVKFDRSELAENYKLHANFLFPDSKSCLYALADLKSCQISAAMEFTAPKGKKARAVITWMNKLLLDNSLSEMKVSFNWKGRGNEITLSVEDFLNEPELALSAEKDAPKNIRFIYEVHNVRRFKSRKLFIEDLEKTVLTLSQYCQQLELI
ncbi:hypothetical protein ACR9YC_13020 [Parasphingorhabdus sp. DH2-15]|uniref:hypothetical protein n=1 Tax=Parasphingorhabdus sp. DH2-15 TaxID=3444112 RepID=UPI003F683F88